MKFERTKNATRNIFYGGILKIYQIIVPFIMRTIFIKFMGPEYLGLNSLFASVLQVLNLAELGVGSAMVYSMYKPIAKDDKDTLCALMRLYQKYYRIIGSVILIVGLCVTPIIPKLIKTDTVPADINIYVLYLINLAVTVVSYWLYAYKNCLLGAFQRNDITSKISIFSSTITYILQLIVIIFLKNFYVYYVIALAIGIVNNLVTAFIVNRIFPEYQPKGELDTQSVKEINQKVKDLFTSKIGFVIYDCADTIVISAFLGMTILAMYQNYFYILSSVAAFIYIIFASITAGIGNSLVVETKEKNFNDLKKLTFIICWISNFCACCLLCLFQPFMELWMGKELMFEDMAVTCLVIYFFVKQINSLLNIYKDASGMWHEDKYRPLAAAMTNLALNLILVQFIGIYGVILSTVIAILFVGEPWLLINLFTVIFERKYLGAYLKKLILYCSVTVISCLLCKIVSEMIGITNLFLVLAIRLGVCVIIPNILCFIFFRKTKEFSEFVSLIDRMTKGKVKLYKLCQK